VATVSRSGTDGVRLRILSGAPLDRTADLSPRVRRGITVADAVGAPLLGAVDAAVEAEDDDVRAARAVTVSTAQARTVARGLMLAPLLLVPMVGGLAGVDVRSFYTGSVGRGVLLAGLLLIGAGGSVARTLIARAARPSPEAELEEAVELVAGALAGGVGPAAALRAVAAVVPAASSALHRLALDLDLGIVGTAAVRRGPPEPEAIARLREVLETAGRLGAPAAPTLHRLARDLRAAELTRVLAAAERLPAQLTVPTTLLLLPATLLLVGAPLVSAGFANVL
jgi:tight adherence protein B